MDNRKMLIVEDSVDIQEMLEQLFTHEGYEVDCVSNGQEALDFLNRAEILPRLILLDLMMPVMDGLTFRSRQVVDSRLSGIPVVIMSADNNLGVKKAKISAADALKKPVDIDLLLETAKKYYLV
jgi:CheY-like chemotaxis protein